MRHTYEAYTMSHTYESSSLSDRDELGEISYGDNIWWEIKWWEMIIIWLSNDETDGDKKSDGDN